LSKKSSNATSSSAAPSTAKGTKDAYLLILPTSTRGLNFASEEQKTHYEILTTRKTSDQKIFHADSLWNLGLLHDMMSLFRNLE